MKKATKYSAVGIRGVSCIKANKPPYKTILKTLVVALGVGLGVWGAVNLMEGYGGDNPSANAHVR